MLALLIAATLTLKTEHYSHPTEYAVSQDTCLIAEPLHTAVCNYEGWLVVYHMDAGQDPSDWIETHTAWTETLQSHDLTRTWTEWHVS